MKVGKDEKTLLKYDKQKKGGRKGLKNKSRVTNSYS